MGPFVSIGHSYMSYCDLRNMETLKESADGDDAGRTKRVSTPDFQTIPSCRMVPLVLLVSPLFQPSVLVSPNHRAAFGVLMHKQ